MKRSKEKVQKIYQCLNSFFDKIYVISLQRSKNRHELLLKQLEGLVYEYFWGVNGEYLDLEHLQDINLYSADLTMKKTAQITHSQEVKLVVPCLT